MCAWRWLCDQANTKTQVWYTAYMPISTGAIMDRYGKPYNITSILRQTSVWELDEEAYHAYSPIFISASFSITYAVAFALSTAVIVHTLLHHAPHIWRGLRKRQVEAADVHAKLMRSYASVPPWYVQSQCSHTSHLIFEVGGFPFWRSQVDSSAS